VRRRVLVAIVAAAVAVLAGTAQGAESCGLLWQIATSMPTGGLVNKAAYGNSIYVAVGPNGELETSADGLTWERQCSPSTEEFVDIAFGNSRFVATSGGIGHFKIHESRDGITWQTTSLDDPSLRVAFSRFLFAGDYFFGIDTHYLFASRDGLSWTGIGTGQRSLEDVCYGQGVYLAVDGSGNYFTSRDLSTWSSHTFPYPGGYGRLVYGGGTFVTVAYTTTSPLILSSTDAVTWTIARYTPSVSWNCTALYGAGRFFLLESGRGMWSQDGASWTNFAYDTSFPTSLFWTGSQFMGFDRDGSLVTSEDGFAWENHSTGGIRGGPFKMIASDSPRAFVVVGSEGLAGNSPDGRSWTFADLRADAVLADVASGGGRLVAVGSTIFISDDGATWREVSPPIPESLHAVSYGAGTFVAEGRSGIVFTSPDGESWTQRDTGFRQTINGIAYGNGRFVAVGDGGSILRSFDGLTWSGEEWPNSGIYYPAVSYGNGVFVVGTNQSHILVGSDGAQWQHVPIMGNAQSVDFAGGYFFIRGSVMPAASEDGVHWVDLYGGLGRIDRGPVSDGTTFVAVEANALVWAGACFPSVASVDHDTLPPGGGMTVTLTGSHLTGATKVRVGDVLCPSFTVVSDSQIQAVSPPHPQGMVSVTVTTPGGTSPTTSATTVVVGTRPSIASIKKLSNPYRLKILGSGFEGDSIILVDGTEVPKTTYKTGEMLLAQGGTLLKVRFIKGTPAQIVVVNTNTGFPSQPYTFVP
jgi:hypothetical protein